MRREVSRGVIEGTAIEPPETVTEVMELAPEVFEDVEIDGETELCLDPYLSSLPEADWRAFE